MRGNRRALKVVASIALLYVLIWFTDSIWEYIPESTPSKPARVESTPAPASTFECQTYWNAAGDAESNCDPVELDNPGWEGR